MVDGGANRFGVARRNRAELGAGVEVNRLIRHISVRFVPNAVAIFVASEERVKHPTVEVIFETADEKGFLNGYTANYTPVKAKLCESLCGRPVKIKITDAEDDFCIGVTDE